MSAPFDRRITPARADLAAEHLRGLVDAPRYAKGREARIVAASAPLRRSPEAFAPLETEALYGESVTVYDERDGWAWAQLQRDLYVGYLPAEALGTPSEPTHRVAALRTHAYPGPSIKLVPRMALSLGAQLTIAGREGDFAISADGLHFWSRHLAELGAHEPDPVAIAELFLETPYLWGGRTSEGIDCSGLVQAALTAAGVASPRDSDMQEAALGEPVAIDDPDAPLKRGDLVFWKGHVGIMRDFRTLLHANGWHMKAVSEPLAQARTRIAAGGGGKVTSVRRLKTPLPSGEGQG
jgi:cell wall-associated NlpC family hydrolase